MPKLALISAVARTGKYTIDLEDVERAIEWLTSAEVLMPDIFRSMLGKSDSTVIEELHHFLTQMWAKNKKPIFEGVLIEFVHQRTTSDKVDKIFQIAERMGVIERVAGTATYLPKARHHHGVE